MKKIMYITQSNGGVAKYLQMLFKYMDRNEYKQVLVYPKQYINEKESFEKLVDNIEFISMSREINFFKDFKAILEIYKLIKKYNPDLIYLNSSKAGALGRVANIIKRKTIIYNPHGWAFNMNVSTLKKKIYIYIERVLAVFTDRIIVISEQEKNSAIKNGICKDNIIELIFNGIDIEEYDSKCFKNNDLKKKLGIKKDKFIIGMVGRISEQKSPDIFIKIAYKIKEKIDNAFFIIVGDGEERDYIEVLIKELGLTDSVLITGWVNDVYEYINIFDIAMLLSRWEGFGLAIAEYMISQKPIIATNIDAIPNLIENNVEGILISSESIDEGVDAILKVINDNKFTKNIIYNANKKVRDKFDVRRVTKEHNILFEKLMDNGSL